MGDRLNYTIMNSLGNWWWLSSNTGGEPADLD